MTDMCEIAEATGACASSTAATTAVMVHEAGAMASRALLGVTLGLASAAACVSTADPSSYALLLSTAAGGSTVATAVSLTNTEASAAAGASHTVVEIPLTLSSTAAGASSAYPELPPPVLTSAGVASSAASGQLVFSKTLSSDAAGASVLTSYHEETSEAEAAAASAVLPQLVATATATATGAGASTALPSNVPTLPILESTGTGNSAIVARTDWIVIAESEAATYSAVYFKDPGRVAWVLNTESTAASWYTNFDMHSIAQVDNAVFAVGPEGVFELTGDDDAGEPIDAGTRSGFMDFGSSFTKRLENMYLGYTSTGTLSTRLSVKESRHLATRFYLEQRTADAPRNGRVVPGKGMWGRYWMVEMNNVNGADFSVYDIEVDIATSPRKL